MESVFYHLIKGCVFVILFELHLHNLTKIFSSFKGPVELKKVFVLLPVIEFKQPSLTQS